MTYPELELVTPTKLKKVEKGELFAFSGPAEDGGSWDWVRFTPRPFPCRLARIDCRDLTEP